MRDIYVIAPVVGKQLDFGYLEKATVVSRLRQTNGKSRPSAAFLGEPGTYSHRACNQYFGPEVAAVSKPTFRSIFEAVKTGEVNFGVVPLENSLSGSIHANYDLLLEYDLRIIGELTLRIIHHLIAHPGTRLEDIQRVLSQAQAFQQCGRFLESHGNWELVPVKDTASAVKAISTGQHRSDAAIGSKEAAEIYRMTVIEEGIETDPRNYTRFAVVGTQPLKKGPYGKSSLIFSTGHQPGSLFEVLKVFAENAINLVKLESRPIHGKPWEYMFYADVEADVEAETFKPVLTRMIEKTDFLKILGSY